MASYTIPNPRLRDFIFVHEEGVDVMKHKARKKNCQVFTSVEPDYSLVGAWIMALRHLEVCEADDAEAV